MNVDSSHCIVWVPATDRVRYKFIGDFSLEFNIFLLELEMIPNYTSERDSERELFNDDIAHT